MSIDSIPEISNNAIQPYTIDVADGILQDLGERLANTRWLPRMAGSSWDRGMDPTYLRELVEYWRDGYDWRNEQSALLYFGGFAAVLSL